MGGRHVQSPQQIQPTGESRYRNVRVRCRDARWRRRGSVIDADLNMLRNLLSSNAWVLGPGALLLGLVEFLVKRFGCVGRIRRLGRGLSLTPLLDRCV